MQASSVDSILSADSVLVGDSSGCIIALTSVISIELTDVAGEGHSPSEARASKDLLSNILTNGGGRRRLTGKTEDETRPYFANHFDTYDVNSGDFLRNVP